MSNSHARRFVRSAWTLLSFQLVASVGAVAVTGVAAFHVQRLAVELEAARNTETAEISDPVTSPEIPADPATVEGPRAEAVESSTEAPADPAARAPEDPAAAREPPADPAATDRPTATVVRCQGQANVIRVQANTLWCDTGVEVRRGQRIIVSAQGNWSHGTRQAFSAAGSGRRSEAAFSGDAPLGALLGRVGEHVFPIGAGGTIEMRTNGTLHFGINDIPAEIGDNQGFVDVFLQLPAGP